MASARAARSPGCALVPRPLLPRGTVRSSASSRPSGVPWRPGAGSGPAWRRCPRAYVPPWRPTWPPL
eukprot:15107069-Alexandrium_andersonii.AAC.1